MRRGLLLVLCLAWIAPGSAMAQTCLGLGSFSHRPVQLNGQALVAAGSNSLAAELGYGLPASVFGSLRIGSSSIESEGSSIDVGTSLGYQVNLAKSGDVQVCPVASGLLGIGPKNTFNSGVDRSSRVATVGLALGASFPAGPRFTVIPTAGISYAQATSKAESAIGETLFTIANRYGLAQAGVGIVLDSALSLRPQIEVPLGLAGGNLSVGLTLSYNFGRSHSPAYSH